MGFIKKQLTDSQVYGSGLAFILIFLLMMLFTEARIFLYGAVIATVVLLAWPAPFRYFGIFWFSLGEALGYVVSRILLTLIFFLIVTPVSVFKRKSIRRRMKLDEKSTGPASVFITRDHRFTPSDFVKPF